MEWKSNIQDLDKKLDKDFTDNFSKETGDFASLSDVDRHVIALGVNQARMHGEEALVRKAPKELEEFRPKQFQGEYDKLEDWMSDTDSDGSDSDKRKPSAEDDEWETTVAETPAQKRMREKLEEKMRKKGELEEQPKEEVIVEEKKEDSDEIEEIDNEEEGGAWITEENLH